MDIEITKKRRDATNIKGNNVESEISIRAEAKGIDVVRYNLKYREICKKQKELS